MENIIESIYLGPNKERYVICTDKNLLLIFFTKMIFYLYVKNLYLLLPKKKSNNDQKLQFF